MGFLLLLPVLLIAAAAVASIVFVRLSTLRVSADGVEIRNFPQDTRVVPLEQVDRFVETERSGGLGFLRPATATLLLVDGTRVPVRSLRERDGAYGVDELNARLARLRGGA